MEHVLPAFKEALWYIEALSDKGLPGYQKIIHHLIFDVKMEYTRKSRFVAGGYLADPPESITYSSVVSGDIVRIAFLIASFNDLDVCVRKKALLVISSHPSARVACWLLAMFACMRSVLSSRSSSLTTIYITIHASLHLHATTISDAGVWQ